MKKLISALLLLCMIFATFPITASSPVGKVALSVTADKLDEIKPGDVVTVTVAITEFSGNLSCLGFYLNFDETAFAVGTPEAVFPDGLSSLGHVIPNQAKGYVAYSAGGVIDATEVQLGTILTIPFTALKSIDTATAFQVVDNGTLFNGRYEIPVTGDLTEVLMYDRIGNISVGITVPVKDAIPQLGIPFTDVYSGSVSWVNSPAKFEANTEYSANVYLFARDGYRFSDTATVTVPGGIVSGVRVSGEGKYMNFTVTFPKTGLAGEIKGAVVIEGKTVEGETLTANIDALNSGTEKPGIFTFQWYRDGVEIYNATGMTYKLTDEDVGKKILVAVKNSSHSGTAVSAAVGPVTAPEAPSIPTIKPTEPEESDTPVVPDPPVDEPEKPVFTNPFTDVMEADWFYSNVMYVAEKELMSGTADDIFSPYVSATRGMLVTVLYRIEGQPMVEGASSFTDVADGQWYANAVAWAAENKIVEGKGDGIFAPDEVITREAMATILYRYAKYKGVDVSKSNELTSFTDSDKVNSWAADALKWATAEEIIKGDAGLLTPAGEATRAQLAAILSRFFVLIEK